MGGFLTSIMQKIDYSEELDLEKEREKLKRSVALILRRMMEECYGCGICLSHCPYNEYDKKTARKIMTEIKEYAESPNLSKKLSRKTKKYIWTCCLCETCNLNCPLPVEKQLPKSALALLLRYTLVRKNQAPFMVKIARLFLKDIENPIFKNIWPIATKLLVEDWYGEDEMYLRIRRKMEKVQQKPKSGAEVCFFGGCGHTWMAPDAVYQVISTLEEAGEEIVTIGHPDYCCGLVYALLGFLERWMEQTYKLYKSYLSLEPQPKKLLLHCPGCTTIHLFDMAKYGVDLPLDHLRKMPDGVEMMHISEHVLHLLNEGNLKLDTPVPLTVTYNDNCSIGRRMRYMGREAYEEPRKILNQIPGITLVESDFIREESPCCGLLNKTFGFGTNFKNVFHDPNYSIHEKLFKNLHEKGSHILLTPCMGCELTFEDGARVLQEKLGYKIQIMDLNEVVSRAQGKVIPQRQGLINDLIMFKFPLIKPRLVKFLLWELLPRIIKTRAYKDIYRLIKETLIYLLSSKKNP